MLKRQFLIFFLCEIVVVLISTKMIPEHIEEFLFLSFSTKILTTIIVIIINKSNLQQSNFRVAYISFPLAAITGITVVYIVSIFLEYLNTASFYHDVPDNLSEGIGFILLFILMYSVMIVGILWGSTFMLRLIRNSSESNSETDL